MSAATLLLKLRRLGVVLWADGERLQYDAPAGVLTEELRNELRALKAEILDLLRESKTAERKAPPLTRTPKDGDRPVSSPQRQLFFLDRLGVGAAYNVRQAARLRGPLDVDALQRSMEDIVRRHEILRTTFPIIEGQPVQRIASAGTVSLSREDLSHSAPASREEEARRLVEAESREPFDLARGPLLKSTLIRLDTDDHVLLLTMHHIITDGWSNGVLMRDLSAYYEAHVAGTTPSLPELPIQYADYAQWQNEWLQGDFLNELLVFWRSQLGPNPTPLSMPTDRPRPAVMTYEGAEHRFELSASLCAALQSLCRRHGVTMAMTLMAAFQALLGRYTGKDDVIVGSPMANRNRSEFENLIGFFTNSLVMRTDLSGDPTFAELLARVRQVSLGAYDHQELPFEQLVKALAPERDTSVNPIFQVSFAMQNAPSEGLVLPGLQVERFGRRVDTTHLELELHILEGAGELTGQFVYNTDLFDATTIERMAGHYQNLLRGAVQQPDRRIAELPVLGNAERRRVLVEWNDTAAPYPRDACIHTLFDEHAARIPDAIAVEFEGQKVTYDELNRRANQVAHRLIGYGVGPEAKVGIAVERSIEMVVGILGVLKAGAAYVPLDPSYPSARLALMIEDARMPLLLAQPQLAETLPAGQATVVPLEPDAFANQPTTDPPRTAAPSNLAYVMYTSGSTGRPKGVCVTHRNVIRLVRNTNYLTVRPDDVFLQFAPISFDASTLELWGSLLNGAKLMVFPPQTPSLEELGRVLETHGITTLWLTGALFQQMVNEQLDRLAGVRQLLAGGDALSVPHVRRMLERREGEQRLINGYGPTENTTFTCCHVMDRNSAFARGVPIGRPIANTTAYILDAHLEPVPVGVTGELYTGGDGVARGYLNDPALTAARFIPDPFGGEPGSRLYRTGDLARHGADGTTDFFGRVDFQAKVRGFRIEPGEIEMALLDADGVREAVVVSRADSSGEKQLVAYVAAAPGHELSRSALRDRLAEYLPGHMIPSAVVFLDAMPLSPNGKVDRGALPEPSTQRQTEGAIVAPRGETESLIAAIWRDVLDVETVGVHDNFFDLGGDSLLLTQVHARLVERLDRDFAITDLFQHSTVASLAGFLRDEAPAEGTYLQAARERRSEGAAAGATERTAVAIIGMAGRFPGAANVAQFWDNLCGGVESITFLSEAELRSAGVEERVLRDPAYVPAKGVLEEADCFDGAFFGYSPREAEISDPQQRVILECAWSALEAAGYDPTQYAGRIGVYVGAGVNNYDRGLRANPAIMASVDPLALKQGNEADFVATRIAYKLNLLGPAVSVQTACSSSLVAAHEACKSLLAGECSMALAGGVHVTVPLHKGYPHQEGGIMSRDGHNRTFDADATGTVGSDGVGLVLLKRLEDALAENDTIHAVILGSAINNDGSRKVGFTAPSVGGQADAVASALSAADVDPATIGYVEAHGTATELGDPVEVTVLTQVFSEATDRRQYCAIGTLKTNVGHMDTAAGIGGLMKATLAVEHGKIPPSLHYRAPNPKIDFESSPFFVNTVLREWETDGHPRRAGVSSLGMGGTNVHVVLEEAPAIAPSDPARSWQLLTISARTPCALERATDDLVQHLESHPEINLADVAFTLQAGRKDFKHRRMVVVEDVADATRVLAARDVRRVVGAAHDGGETPVVFMFPGQGAQHSRMGHDLYETQPLFRAEVDRCCAAIEEPLGLDLRTLLFPDPVDVEDAARRLERTAIAQPALFTIEHALAHQWMAWGIEPAAMIGHSIGEYVAACVAGVMSPEDAVAIVAERGRLMGAMPDGAMLAVALSPDELETHLPSGLAIATINGPELCVVSGTDDDVTAFEAALRERGIEPQRLHTSHAFHSSMMEPIVKPFVERVAGVRLSEPRRPYVSNVTGTWITNAEATDPAYYGKHLRQAVRFSAGLETLFEDADRVLLEVGPGRTLGSLACRHPARPARHTVISSLRHPKEKRPDEAAIGEALGRLWLAGAGPRWRDVHAGARRRRIVLPTYPFERRRYWIDPPQETAAHPALRRKTGAENWIYAPSWRRTTMPTARETERGRFLLFVDGDAGATVAQALRHAGHDVVHVTIGDRYERAGDDGYVIEPTNRAHYERLLSDLDARGGRPGHIAHFWSLAVGDRSPDRVLDLGLYSIVRLMQAMEQGGAEATGDLTIVTRHAHEVTGAEPLQPLQAAALGPAKAIALEFPGMRCRSIDLDEPADTSGRARRAHDLAMELAAPPRDGVVAYRGRHRWLQTFASADPGVGADAPAAMRERGVYLITGGLGGVGFVTAGWLARSYRARLVLVGRSALPPREQWDRWLLEHAEDDATSVRIRGVQSLEEAGAEVIVVCADVTDEAAMRDVLDAAVLRFGTLHGVIHAAGETEVRTPLRSTDRAACERVFRVKRQGVLVLDRLLEGRSLDFCVVHSSLAAVMGAMEMVAYTAAHLFMDAFVWERRRTSTLPWMTVNWDTWQTWRTESKTLPPGVAEFIMTPEDAAEALERVFAGGDYPQLLISTGDLEARIERSRCPAGATEQAADPSERVELHPRSSALSSTYEAPRTDAERLLTDIWQQLLGIEQIGIHDNFFELGGDSVLNLQIVTKAKQAGLLITPKAVFDHQTIASLAAIAERADAPIEVPPTSEAGIGERETAEQRAEGYSVASLSDRDLAAIRRQLRYDDNGS